jgi:hypothetical protein
MTSQTLIAVTLLFFFVAALYGSAGFGGGSSYLAILVLFVGEMTLLRTSALLCNVTVVSVTLFSAWRAGALNKKLLLGMLPLLLVSVPFAYLAGQYALTQPHFLLLLGAALLLAAGVMYGASHRSESKPAPHGSTAKTRIQDFPFSAALGGLAGLVGIGGGIFLSPYLHLSNWSNARTIALTTAAFIWVNSVAGLFGYWQSGTLTTETSLLLPLLVAVFAGGYLGARLNLKRFSHRTIRKVTAVVIFIAGINVLRKYGMS